MVVTIIDDMISSENVTVGPGEHIILYRKINLQRGMCRRLKQIDIFDDIDFWGQGLNPGQLSYQFTVSTFPIVYNEQPWLGNQNSMPYAGERHILFNKQAYFDSNSSQIREKEFPSP